MSAPATDARPAAPVAPGGYLLEAIGVSKQFLGVKALKNVTLRLRPGSVHALMGENSAGKSTLMKILAGVMQPTTGGIRAGGQPCRFGFVDHAAPLEQLGLQLNPDERVGNLVVANQQMVEIAKAVSYDSNILILDEPASSLTGTRPPTCSTSSAGCGTRERPSSVSRTGWARSSPYRTRSRCSATAGTRRRTRCPHSIRTG